MNHEERKAGVQAILDEFDLYRWRSETRNWIEYRVRGTNELLTSIAEDALDYVPSLEYSHLTIMAKIWRRKGLGPSAE